MCLNVSNSFNRKDYLTLNSLNKSNVLYDGTSNKLGVIFNGSNWFIKFNKKFESESYSEFVSSKVFKYLDVNCQNVKLGLYNNEVTVLIEDFTTPNCVLHSFNDVNQSSEDTLLENKEYTYDEVIYLINSNNKLSDLEKEKCINQFWDMFIIDAILGNRDRHKGNWGYLKYLDGHCECAPIFDNNGSLFPGVGKLINDDFEITHEFLVERSDYFPASKFKINYYELFRRKDLPREFSIRLNNFKSKIEHINLVEILENVLCHKLIKNVYREFYFKIVLYRLLRIIYNFDYNEIEKEVTNLWKRSSLKNHSTL